MFDVSSSILFRYTHAERVWEFLRYDNSNKLVVEGESEKHKLEQQPTSPLPTFGPVPLFKWPETKLELSEESMSNNVNLSSAPSDLIFCLFFQRIKAVIMTIVEQKS